ncbi:hypothetical protein CKD15_15480 [Salmonella enterica subsp. enterica serovar Montevideo]|uniref:Uncharacterized protein n=1 Tax=Salmonella enterica TaxID=28901 RepID=A0A5T6NJQ1_SALER|nr:hypothetical protein [Salmonella enterica]EBP3754925.1 hypothetical protein [Salmonella enterica subsp. enterica]EDD4286613.1 hypothetical protein [Salmonella enterica subsp. enterica serovar Give]EDK2959895.1 hypothetical protein [Salmonella enterica subsp. enterica serovar Montevideo]EAP2541893.1 hypothetical protein [Salmonella enterica]
MWSIFGYGGKYHFFIDYMQKISLRKGDLPPLRGGLPAVECGFAPHTRPLKATNYHSSVVTVWTLPSLQFHVVD